MADLIVTPIGSISLCASTESGACTHKTSPTYFMIPIPTHLLHADILSVCLAICTFTLIFIPTQSLCIVKTWRRLSSFLHTVSSGFLLPQLITLQMLVFFAKMDCSEQMQKSPSPFSLIFQKQFPLQPFISYLSPQCAPSPIQPDFFKPLQRPELSLLRETPVLGPCDLLSTIPFNQTAVRLGISLATEYFGYCLFVCET